MAKDAGQGECLINRIVKVKAVSGNAKHALRRGSPISLSIINLGARRKEGQTPCSGRLTPKKEIRYQLVSGLRQF